MEANTYSCYSSASSGIPTPISASEIGCAGQTDRGEMTPLIVVTMSATCSRTSPHAPGCKPYGRASMYIMRLHSLTVQGAGAYGDGRIRATAGRRSGRSSRSSSSSSSRSGTVTVPVPHSTAMFVRATHTSSARRHMGIDADGVRWKCCGLGDCDISLVHQA